MTRTLTSMQWGLALLATILLMAAAIPTGLGGSGGRGPVINWPPYCPPSC
jgi:hypothetical protein